MLLFIIPSFPPQNVVQPSDCTTNFLAVIAAPGPIVRITGLTPRVHITFIHFDHFQDNRLNEFHFHSLLFVFIKKYVYFLYIFGNTKFLISFMSEVTNSLGSNRWVSCFYLKLTGTKITVIHNLTL